MHPEDVKVQRKLIPPEKAAANGEMPTLSRTNPVTPSLSYSAPG